MPIRCLSSHAMAYVVTKRNPVGSEESWLLSSQEQALGHPSIPVKLITSLALGCLTMTASLETVAYAAINLASRAWMISERPYLWSKELLESSSFTMLWSSVDALIHNFLFPTLLTHESFARLWARNFPPAKSLFRLSDQIAIHEWARARRNVLRPDIVAEWLKPIIQNC